MVRERKGYDTQTAMEMFTAGKKAEVAFDDDDPREVWFPAIVLKQCGDGYYLVEYYKPGIGDQAVLHKATVNFWHIRPPPTHQRDMDIVLNDKVDAYYDYGWWYGIITKVFPDHRYNVFFKHTKKEREFICSEVRPHREWSLPRRFVMTHDWYSGRSRDRYLGSSKGDKENIACDLHTKQIELTTPNTGTQSTGRTSIMKPAKQTIVDSYDDNSPPSKKKKNESVLDDSSKNSNGTSAGQSEGLNSEFGKTENLSHGKKLCSTRGKGIEREPPAMESSKKKGKAANENTSSNLGEGAKGDSGKTKTQESVEKDATKDLAGLQYNEITVSQEKENIACDLHTKQIELTTPNTGTQSTGRTSIMKPAKQTIVDSYDDNSPPSKKKKNESVLDDSSKNSNGTSAGQSEGLNSEFGKTENLSHGKKLCSTRGKGIEREPPAMESSKKKGKAANENTSSNLGEGAKGDSGKTKTQESVEKDATKDLAGLQYNEITVSQEKEVNEDDASAVASKRKRRRPLRLQAKSPVTLLTASHESEGVDPSAASVVDSAQMKEVSSPTSSGTKSLERDQEPLKQDKLHNESQEQDLKAKRSGKKYSSGRGKRGKRQTNSINTEAPVQDSQDASKEKAYENMETRKTDAFAGKLLDIVSDDQPLSRWIDGMHSPIPIHSPASESQLDAVTMNAENLPFVKRSPLWHTIEAMEAFQKIPQNPHFRPLLEGVKASAREGLAIGTMVTFSTVVDNINRLGFEDPRSTIEDCLETLVELESNGFDVDVIRDRLTRLLLLKDKKEELEDWSKGVEEKLEQKIQEKTIDDEVDVIDTQIRQLEETRRKVLLTKEEWNLEVDAMKATEEAMEQKIMEVAAEFDRLAVAPFVN